MNRETVNWGWDTNMKLETKGSYGISYFLYKRSGLGISLCRRKDLWGRRVRSPLACHQQQMVWETVSEQN